MKTLLILTCAVVLTACGGGEQSSHSEPRACVELSAAQPVEDCTATTVVAQDARRTALAVPPSGLTATEIMNWAERVYPALFPGHKVNQRLDPYTYRHYPETGNYVGVGSDSIYLAGPVVGQAKGTAPAPVFFSDASQFTSLVKAGNDPQGLFVSAAGFVLIEPDGTTWVKWEADKAQPPDAALGKVAVADGHDLSVNSHSLSYTQTPYKVEGTYEPKVKLEVTLTGNPVGPRSFSLTYDPAYDKPLTLPVGAFTTIDFYSGLDTRFNITASGTFTGSSGPKAPAPQCSFSGQLTGTGKSYQKVAITFTSNCAVPNGTKGTGVLTRYVDGVYLFSTVQPGQYGEQSFVAFITVK